MCPNLSLSCRRAVDFSRGWLSEAGVCRRSLMGADISGPWAIRLFLWAYALTSPWGPLSLLLLLPKVSVQLFPTSCWIMVVSLYGSSPGSSRQLAQPHALCSLNFPSAFWEQIRYVDFKKGRVKKIPISWWGLFGSGINWQKVMCYAWH